ncbi:MAG: hypothetical protein C0505_06750 [Leptothrix sp. (in: Bacteria)]|nr:hypothetical protein [Leptothrix sp. (in: b-proteobacteria)]
MPQVSAMVARSPSDPSSALPPGHPEPRELPELSLSVPGHRQALEPARRSVIEFLAAFDLSPRTLFNVELALEETLINAMVHAFGDGAVHVIELHLRLTPDDVELTFEDDGLVFDPTQAADAARPASIEEARPGGLGLMLVRKLARSVAYERRDGRNSLLIRVARHADGGC